MKQWLIGLGAVVFFGMACLSLCTEDWSMHHSNIMYVSLDHSTPD